jgi:hypothetical protein
MALKQKPAWDVSSSGIINRGDSGPFEAGRHNAKCLLAAGIDLFFAWITARLSLICARADCRYEQNSIAGRKQDFPGESARCGYRPLSVKAILVMPLQF